MSSTVKRTVALTADQWAELLTTGQTTDNKGVIHYYDESGETDYNANMYNEIIALNNKIDRMIIKPNQLATNRNIRKSLLQSYEDLITENPELSNRGCVGFVATLKPNETVMFNPSPTTYERCFLNGVERGANYTYDGEHTETVVVFYFSSEIADVQLGERTHLTIEDLLIKKGMRDVNIDVTYYYNINHFYGINTTIKPNMCKYFYNLADNANASTQMYELYSEAITIEIASNYVTATGCPYLYKIMLPKVTSLAENKYTGTNLITAPNTYCTIETPSLVKINSIASPGSYTRPVICNFSHFKFPRTIREVGFDSLLNIGVIDLTEATEAEFHTRWYLGTPCSDIIMPDQWKHSINLATAGRNFYKEWFIELFYKLAVVEETQNLTIPDFIYMDLTQEEKAIPLSKNWSLGGE